MIKIDILALMAWVLNPAIGGLWHYEQRTQKKIAFEHGEGLRDADGKLIIPGIAMAFRDNYLKDIYETILDPAKFASEQDRELVKSIRKAVPMGMASKVFR
jgi:hypothetical protein